MLRHLPLILALALLSGCGQDVEQQASANGAGAELPPGADAKVARANRAQPASAKSTNRNDSSGSRLRDKYEDEITTEMGRAILDTLEEAEGGTDEEFDAIIATLKENDELLHRASGRRAKELILQNNNRPRSLYVAPPSD